MMTLRRSVAIHIVVFIAGLMTEGKAEGQCYFSGRAYDQGVSWYPRIPTDNSICVRCNCMQAGKIDCSPKQCPGDCTSDSADSECCKICEESHTPSRKKVDVNEDKSSSSPMEVPKEESSIPCMHNSIRYSDGQSFTSNSTGLSARKSNQCVQCVCKRGLVLCRLRTCPAEHCETPVDVQDNCCPVCLGDKQVTNTDDQTTEKDDGETVVLEDDEVNRENQDNADSDFFVTFNTPKANNEQKERDCKSSGKRYTHGSSWHPIIGPFGQMECVICKCLFGRIECKRLSCKPKQKLPCSNPIKTFGNCCYVCPGSDVKSSSKRFRPNKGPRKNEEIRPNNNNYITATQVFSSTDKKLCVDATTSVVVYKSHASTDTSGYYQYAFQDAAASNDADVDVYSWTFTDGQFGYFATQHLSKSDFLVLSSTFTFQVMGATHKKFGEKFVKRAKRLQKKCTSRCHRRMERLQRNLKLKPVLMRIGSCLEDEIFLKT